MSTMPVAFIGHGSPMNTLETNRFTSAWSEFAGQLPRPRAILSISAHWYVNSSVVTAMPDPRTIHDFYGFPQELFDVRYEAPGSPELAEEVAELAKPTWVGLDRDSWGLDHGTWSVLAHMFPSADVPVVQLSIDASKGPEYHLELGASLAPLRERDVLIIASGNIVHNLRLVDWEQPEGGFDWAWRFDDAARRIMLDEPGRAAALSESDDYGLAVPTPDHFFPLLYVAGLAEASGDDVSVIVEGCVMGSLSMTSYCVSSAL